MRPVLKHIRLHSVAYLALFVALGGTSYAAFKPPPNSVGTRQIKNHAITAVKLDPKSIAASIRAWVILQWGPGGRLVAEGSSSPVRVGTSNQGENITWPRRRFAKNCLPSVTARPNGFNPSVAFGTYVVAELDPTATGGASLQLVGFAPSGARSPQAAYVMIVCP
jgi:hypothetical protein